MNETIFGGKIERKSREKVILEINKIYKYSDVNNNNNDKKKPRQIRDPKPKRKINNLFKNTVEVVLIQVQTKL